MMQQVIEQYMQVDSHKQFVSLFYEEKYPFSNIYGANSDDEIRLWIKKYSAILFIHQYTIPMIQTQEYEIYFNPLEMPELPKEFSKLNYWKRQLVELQGLVTETLSQKELLTQLGLGQFSQSDWFEKNEKIAPSKLIEGLKKEIEEKMENIKQQPIDPKNEKKFKEKTKDILKPVLELFSTIIKNEWKRDDFQSDGIDGVYAILDRFPFSKDQDMGYSNTDSITADAVVVNFQNHVLDMFFSKDIQKYVIAEKDLFSAVDQLKIDAEHFVIISIGVRLKDFLKSGVQGLEKRLQEEWFYKGIRIFNMNIRTYNKFRNSLFILKKEDLPNIEFKELDAARINKYHLEEIDKEFHIYAGLNDLNLSGNESLKDEVQQQNLQTDLSQKVMAYVDINAEVQYKKDAKCVQLKVFSQFEDRGIANKPEDIEPYE